MSSMTEAGQSTPDLTDDAGPRAPDPKENWPRSDFDLEEELYGLERLDRQWKQRFILSLRLNPNIRIACQEGNVSRQSAYNMKASDNIFSQLWDDAMQGAVDQAEGTLYEVANRGDVRALEIFLQAKRPNEYRQKAGATVNIGAAVGLNDLLRRIRSGGMRDPELKPLPAGQTEEVKALPRARTGPGQRQPGHGPKQE